MNPTSSATNFFALFASISIAWVFPLLAVVQNQQTPSYESALAVPYAFMIGCAIHFVILLAWIGLKKARLSPVETFSLAISFALIVALTVISDGGTLSVLKR